MTSPFPTAGSPHRRRTRHGAAVRPHGAHAGVLTPTRNERKITEWGDGGASRSRAVSNLDQQLASLSPDQRRALAVVAAAGSSTLSPEQVSRLTGVGDAASALAQLRALGLLREAAPERFSAPAALRRSWELAGEAESVLDRVVTLLEDGRFSREDVDALLGLAESAAGAGSWGRVLKLVQAARLPLEAWRRVDAWIELVERGQTAAQRLGDVAAEAWLAREHRAALAARSRQARPPGLPRGTSRLQARVAYSLVGVVLAAGGFLAGAAIGDDGNAAGAVTGGTDAGTVTETVVRTQTDRIVETATETERIVETATETRTVATTETVTVTEPPPPPVIP